DLPSVDMSLPSVDVDLPSLPDVDLPSVDMSLPSVDVDLPDASVKLDAAVAGAAVVGTGLVGIVGDADDAAAKLTRIGDKDDLTLIEGIGRKIAGLMRGAGIHTFAQLAETSVEELQRILNRGGSNFNRADPQTWPEQARLAAEGRMDELKALQDTLKGGVYR
ncbi:MAG: helix-hairpin-helix domain-containing protein, partial [Anaerolineae bacterium]